MYQYLMRRGPLSRKGLGGEHCPLHGDITDSSHARDELQMDMILIHSQVHVQTDHSCSSSIEQKFSTPNALFVLHLVNMS